MKTSRLMRYFFGIVGFLFLLCAFLYVVIWWDTIESKITELRIPNATRRYHDAVTIVTDEISDSLLEKNTIINPHVPVDEDSANCIIAGDIYIYGSLNSYSYILKSYEERLIQMNFKYSQGLSYDETTVYYDSDKKLILQISQVKNTRISWSIYATIYQIQFNYAEPSLSCYPPIYSNLN